MITMDIKDLAKNRPYLSEDLLAALDYLAATDFSAVPCGEYEVRGREIFARISEYDTAPWEQKKPESHFEYIDVQFPVVGSEDVGFCRMQGGEVPVNHVDPRDDVAFYADAPGEQFVTIGEGKLVIVFPWEMHRPGCSLGEQPTHMKKVVVKVRVRS